MSYARRYMFQCTYVHSLVLCQRQVPGIHLLQNPRSPALLFICNWPWDSSHLLPTQGGAWDWVQVLKSDTMFVLPKAGPWYSFPPNTIPPNVLHETEGRFENVIPCLFMGLLHFYEVVPLVLPPPSRCSSCRARGATRWVDCKARHHWAMYSINIFIWILWTDKIYKQYNSMSYKLTND